MIVSLGFALYVQLFYKSGDPYREELILWNNQKMVLDCKTIF